jgi:dienelactone hydrolase
MRFVAAFCALIAILPITGQRADASEELIQIAPAQAGASGTHSKLPLLGYLLRPDGATLRPAIVILHGCEGFGLTYIVRAREFQSLGYTVLVLDSLGAQNLCASGGGAAAEALDAYAALGWLTQQSFVDGNNVALLGFSMGGVAALMAAERGAMAETFPQHFRAAVAYYPLCHGSSGVMTMPTLILIGAADDWAPAADCSAMMERRAGTGAPVDLRIFPGATHAFNSLAPPHWDLGHFIQFDPSATVAAREAAQAFFHQWLDVPSLVAAEHH